MSDSIKERALDYHRRPTPGKIRVVPTASRVYTTWVSPSVRVPPGEARAGCPFRLVDVARMVAAAL